MRISPAGGWGSRLAPNRRRNAMAALRAAAVLAALLALAGSALPFPTRSRTAIALIDVSDSIGAKGIEASRRAALSLLRGLGPGDRAGLVVFAGKSLVLSPPALLGLFGALFAAAAAGLLVQPGPHLPLLLPLAASRSYPFQRRSGGYGSL